jgi:hypothetical protein
MAAAGALGSFSIGPNMACSSGKAIDNEHGVGSALVATDTVRIAHPSEQLPRNAPLSIRESACCRIYPRMTSDEKM